MLSVAVNLMEHALKRQKKKMLTIIIEWQVNIQIVLFVKFIASGNVYSAILV